MADRESRYTFEVTNPFQPSPELVAQLKAGQDLMQSYVEDVLATFNRAVDRAALLLMEAGNAGVTAWSNTECCSTT